MYKIKVGSSPINCVAWVGSELYMGCDNGNVEIWVFIILFSPVMLGIINRGNRNIIDAWVNREIKHEEGRV